MTCFQISIGCYRKVNRNESHVTTVTSGVTVEVNMIKDDLVTESALSGISNIKEAIVTRVLCSVTCIDI